MTNLVDNPGKMGGGDSEGDLHDSCITQLKAHKPSRTCNESKEEEERHLHDVVPLDLPALFPGERYGAQAEYVQRLYWC